MGFFGNNLKEVLHEFKTRSEYYSNDLNKEIKEFLDDLDSDYEENMEAVPEFKDFIAKIAGNMDPENLAELEDFAARFTKIDQVARHGIQSMREVLRDQRKISHKTIQDFDEFEAVNA